MYPSRWALYVGDVLIAYATVSTWGSKIKKPFETDGREKKIATSSFEISSVEDSLMEKLRRRNCVGPILSKPPKCLIAIEISFKRTYPIVGEHPNRICEADLDLVPGIWK